MSYVPAQEHLERYARLLVGYALGDGGGVKAGEVVRVRAPEVAKPLYVECCRAVWRAGGHVIGDYAPTDVPGASLERDFYELASDAQLDFFAESYYRGLLDQIDHMLYVDGTADPHALAGVDAGKIMRHHQAHRPLVDWTVAKESAGEYTWTVGLYGTEAMAAEARLSIEEYWEQIIAACFLDLPDPSERWREVNAKIKSHCDWLNSLQIDRLHVEGEDIDLWLSLGEKRKWIGGSGRNIPSFEVFTSPDWRGTEGRVRFSEPLYIHGTLITGVELEFADGVVVSSRADENAELLQEMLSAQGANKIGEFSLTDSRLSRITRFMANTLFDENVGGPFGNTHLAVGLSLQHCYDGDPGSVSAQEWERLGFNQSVVHTDIVSTTDRTVTATKKGGGEQVIYSGGQFAGG
ncbi:MAG: aminopeptidase [Solirubrobacteraceae bacterium]